MHPLTGGMGAVPPFFHNIPGREGGKVSIFLHRGGAGLGSAQNDPLLDSEPSPCYVLLDAMIAIIGGTGPEGKGLALRLAAAGEIVMIGSRYRERALAAAEEVRRRVPDAWVRGAINRRAAREADIIIITVPFEGHARVLELLRRHVAGKMVIDAVVPLAFQKGRIDVVPLEEGSAAEQAQRLLPEARVVAAFLNLSAGDLAATDRPLDADVIVCADNAAARNATMALVNRIPGLRAVNGDGLANAHHLEEITALLLGLNRTYRKQTSIRITGI